ncbi:hypothetical protein, partial [Ralstonia pseudosolanacearum]
MKDEEVPTTATRRLNKYRDLEGEAGQSEESNFLWAFVGRLKVEKLPEGWDDFVRVLESEWKDNEVTAELVRLVSDRCITKETLINGVREWNREPSCSRFPHRGKE